MDALFFVTFTEMLFYLTEEERADYLRKLDAEQAIGTAQSDRARHYARQYVRFVFDHVQPIPCKRGKAS